MNVLARILGVIGDSLVHKEETLRLPEDITLKKFFELADRASGHSPVPYFKLCLHQRISPAILINGNPVNLPEGLKTPLKEGDEISVILPLAGG